MDDSSTIEPGRAELVSSRTDESTLSAMEELRALTSVMESLRSISSDEARARILKAAATFFKVEINSSSGTGSAIPIGHSRTPVPEPMAFSSDRTISPKDFLRDKQPKTDVERVACLAYYLTHFRDTPQFKTIEISKLNTEAAQPKLSNAAMAVDNATKSHYLAPAIKGNKQISAAGEVFVQALPDRELARTEMLRVRPRRKRRVTQGRTEEGDSEE